MCTYTYLANVNLTQNIVCVPTCVHVYHAREYPDQINETV